MDETTCSCGKVTRETRVQVPFLDCKLAKRKECRWEMTRLSMSTLYTLTPQDCPGDPVPQGA